MSTFNSFNELHAGQTAMKTDMSVFNGATHGQLAAFEEAIHSARTGIVNAFNEIDLGIGELAGLSKEYRSVMAALQTLSIKASGAARQYSPK